MNFYGVLSDVQCQLIAHQVDHFSGMRSADHVDALDPVHMRVLNVHVCTCVVV